METIKHSLLQAAEQHADELFSYHIGGSTSISYTNRAFAPPIRVTFQGLEIMGTTALKLIADKALLKKIKEKHRAAVRNEQA